MSVYVGNLSWETTQDQLKEHFAQCGDVDQAEVMGYPDGKKKGYGTVRYFKAEDAEKAIETLDGVQFNGRTLQVRLDNRA